MQEKLITKSNLERAMAWVDQALRAVQENIAGGVQPDWNQNAPAAPDHIANRTHWKEVVTGADAGVIFEGDLPFIVYTDGGGGHIQTQVNDISIFFGYAARLTISHGGNNASIDMLAYSVEIGSKTVLGVPFERSCTLSIQKEGDFEYIGVEVSSSVLETLGITSDTQVHIRIEWLPLLLNSASAEMFSMMGLSQFYYDGYHNYYEAPTNEFANLIYQMATQELGGAFVGDYVKAGDILQLVINNGDPISVLMQPRDGGASCEAGNKNIVASYNADTGENWYIICVPGSFKIMIRGIEPQSVEVKFLSRQVVHKLSGEYTNTGKGQLLIQNDDLTPIAVFNPQQDYASIVQVQSPLPSKSGNAGKVLAVNSEENGYEWITSSGGGSGGGANVQADWNETDDSSDAFVRNKPDLSEVALSGSYSDLADTPTIPMVNNAELTIKRNGSTVGTFTANASQDNIIDIAVPVNASDVSALPSSTKYGASMVLSMNTSTYVVTAQLKDQHGNNIGSAQTIDLPLESVVVSGAYNSQTKKVVLTLQGGSTVEFSVADLVSGLQSEISAANKLSADYVQDGTNNKVFTAAEQAKLAGIAAGAEANVNADWNATSGDAKILNKPTIPPAPGTLNTNNASSQSVNSSEPLSGTVNLHKVAKTGSYNDLLDRPTIPTVNNGKLTIQKNGATVGSFSANQSGDTTINIVETNELPTVSPSDNGKILMVKNGVWQEENVSMQRYYSGASVPSASLGSDGDLYLQIM